ncbi:MAG: GNAT family N-acetyltransferase [Pseudomonadota bacterium]
MSQYKVVLLEKDHPREMFDCGVPVLNDFLKKYALQNQRKRLARTYVCLKDETEIVGFYSLSFGSVYQSDVPPFMNRGMGKYQIPVMIIGRLAVSLNAQGIGIGKALLKDAVMRTMNAADIAGLRAILVHAKDQPSREFYLKYGFISSQSNPLTLFWPLEFNSKQGD